MLQLEKELRAQAPNERYKYVWFNGWRSDKDEALWAAFALTFITQMKGQITFCKRVAANLKLIWRRFDPTRHWFQLFLFLLSWVVLIGLIIFAARNPGLISTPKKFITDPHAFLLVPWLAAAWYAYDKIRKIFPDPLSYDLTRFARDLKYNEKVAFIDRFQGDFSDIVKSYVGDKGRVYIFIDDLDRCEIPRAAELLQAINLLLSTDQGNLFFILGLDREMVAAGIAAKNEKIMPYLAAKASSKDAVDIYRTGMNYGQNFMEKFVQVPFRIPRPNDREINHWVGTLTDSDTVDDIANSTESNALDLRYGSDPMEFELVVERIAHEFKFNPRRLKQFINAFRLRVMIAVSTGVLVPAQETDGGAAVVGTITIQQLGLFTAVLMRWPALATDLAGDPTLFHRVLARNAEHQTPIAVKWLENDDVARVIKLDDTYDISQLDLTPMLMLMPDAYSGQLREPPPKQPRTRLVGRPNGGTTGGEANNAPRTDGPRGPEFTVPLSASSIGISSSTTSPTTNVTPTTPVGPTGPTGPRT